MMERGDRMIYTLFCDPHDERRGGGRWLPRNIRDTAINSYTFAYLYFCEKKNCTMRKWIDTTIFMFILDFYISQIYFLVASLLIHLNNWIFGLVVIMPFSIAIESRHWKCQTIFSNDSIIRRTKIMSTRTSISIHKQRRF